MQVKTELRHRLRNERARVFVPTKPSDKNAFGVKSNDQLGFYLSSAPFRVAKGGNRSGKTEIEVFDGVQFARGEHPVRSLVRKPPVEIRFCAPTFPKNIKIILDKLKVFCPRNELKGGSWLNAWSEKHKTLHWENGSQMEFLAYTQDVEAFAGKDLDACYTDEHGPVRYFRENMARLADRKGYLAQTFTPDLGSSTWERRVFRELREKGFQIDEFSFSIFGNPYLSKEGVEQFRASLGGDENLEKIKLYGEYGALGGSVYPQFRRNVHVILERPLPKEWPRTFALDPHMKKAHGMVWSVRTPENDTILYRCAKKFLIISELKAFIRAKSSGERIQLWLGDEAMGGDGLNIFGQKSVIAQLNSGDDRIPIIPTSQGSDKAFEAGVFKVREALTPDPVSQSPKLFIMETYQGESNQDLIDEFEDYQFIPDSKADEMTFRERVRKIDDDLMDCVRYIVMAAPISGRQTKVKSHLDSAGW